MFVAPLRLTVIVAVPPDSPTENSVAAKLNVDTSLALIVRTARLLAPIVGAVPPDRFFGFDRTRFMSAGHSALESSVICTWNVFDISPGAKVKVLGTAIGV